MFQRAARLVMKKSSNKLTRGDGWVLVRNCPRCGRPESECRCRAAATQLPPPAGGRPVIRLRLEKRRGKAVTVLATGGLPPDRLETLARELKSRCATGGTVKDAEIELQGDHREKLRPLLENEGMTVKG
jgi:translation initiation factor 1